MKLKTTVRLITNLIPAALLCFSLIYALTTSLNFTFSIWVIILCTVVPFILLTFVFLNKTSIKISAFFLGLSVVATAAYFLISQGWDTIYYYIQVFFLWIYNFMNNTQSYNELYALIVLIFISVAVSLFVYIFTVRRFSFPVLFLSGTALFVVQGIFNFFSSLTAFFIFCVMIVYYYMKHIHKKNSAAGKNEYAGQIGFFTAILPIVIVMGVLTFILPTSREPVHWKWLDKQYDAIMKLFESPHTDPLVFDIFSLSSTGFGENYNVLGGKVKLNKTSVLKVESPRRLYLKGVVKNIYTGNAWQSSVETKVPYSDNNFILDGDIEETMSSVLSLNPSKKDYSKYMYKDKVTVTFDNLIVRSIFLPLKANNIKFEEKNINFDITRSGIMTTHRPIKKGFEYSFDVYTPKYTNEEVIKLLRNSKPGVLYNKNMASLNRFNDMFGYQLITPNQENTNYTIAGQITDQNIITYPELIKQISQFEYINNIYSLNLKVPDTLPQRVKDLAKSITSGCNNNYDRVKAIEDYLNNNFKYTLEPPRTPANRDFVDYFLFDSKKGYCTYFASSMAILSRCLGIPTRYVEGYMLPSKQNKSGYYAVTNEQAHAWVEVYFEGFGWVPFEATPPFYSSFYNKNSDARLSDEMVKNPSYNSYVEYLKNLAKERGNMQTDSIEVKETSNWSTVFTTLEILLAAILAILLFAFTFNYTRRKLKLLKLLRLTPNECAKGLYVYYLDILEKLGYPIEPGETPYEYSARLYEEIPLIVTSAENSDRFSYNAKLKQGHSDFKYDFVTVTNLVVRAIYDRRSITAEERDIVFEYRAFLLEKTKKKLGKYSYFIKTYILGKL